MPKDEWASTRLRSAIRRGEHDPFLSKKVPKQKKFGAKLRNPKHVAARWSPGGKLWFGRHKDKEIREVPLDYLRWLVNASSPTDNWRMRGLCEFLKTYLPPSA